jgi:hypothetical protein
VKPQIDIATSFSGPTITASRERTSRWSHFDPELQNERSAAGVTHRTEQRMESAFPRFGVSSQESILILSHKRVEGHGVTDVGRKGLLDILF